MSDINKILVVDDDEINRIVLEGMLEREDREIIFAENGREAVEQYQLERPDIILMDVMMPELDGMEATRQIKKIAGEEYIPIIFLTSITEEDELARCVEVGGDDFLTKPFSRIVLESKLTSFGRTRDLYREVRKQNQMIMQEYSYAEKIYSRLFQRGVLDKRPLNFINNPQSMFNGDILLAGERPDGGMNIFIGDATGHGLPAAVGVLPVADIFYSMTESGVPLGEIISHINAKLYQFLPPELFVCGGFVEMAADFNSAKVWNGGLPEALVYNRELGRVSKIFHSNGLPLGIASNQSLNVEVSVWEIDADERLYFFTDGVTEAENESGEMFGIERMTQALAEAHQKEKPFECIEKLLSDFCGESVQSDDITLIEISPSLLKLSK